MTRVITLMPVRLAATRLPNKPLRDINGKSLVQRVYENVEKAMKGKTDIAVAAGDQAIVDECKRFGATAVLTDPNLPSGTDRIAAALKVLDPKGDKYDIVVDFQGDNLNVDPAVCLPLVEMVQRTDCDIATCGMIIKSDEDKNNPNVVKIIMGLKEGEKEGRCLYFTRATAPYTRNPEKCPNQDLYYHIGIYVFKAASLQKMVSLPTGVLEKREALEQLRALENGMSVRAMLIDKIKLVEEAPADINTEEDLKNALPWIK
jgi:3-deoxy-manno-octulosonate cytidylyltransferase (CMP-KDO synthetase)